jgi:hypothetical protein
MAHDRQTARAGCPSGATPYYTGDSGADCRCTAQGLGPHAYIHPTIMDNTQHVSE